MSQVQLTQTLEMQDLLHATFSCISYLRDLFDENSYQDYRFCNVTIKLLKKGASDSSDKFIDWLEKGCYDAITRKYLKSLTIGIYLREDSPKKVSEIYTFEFKYENNEITNTESISKLVRTLCLLTQSLQPLPRVKYVTLKLFYNENTPNNYEPPYFKPAGQHKFEFISEPLKLDVGSTTVNRSEALMKIFTLFDYSNKNEAHKIDNAELLLDTPKNEQDKNIIADFIDSQPLKIPKLENKVIKVKSKEKITKKEINKEKTIKKETDKEKTKCICSNNKNDSDMLFCDRCNSWLHTVCCGFFSKNDKRIPKGEFICDACKNIHTPDNLYLLANQRRILSVIYNEGLDNQNNLALKMNLNRKFVQKIVNSFIQEGFIKRNGSKYEIIKSDKTRKKIKEYFSISANEERASLPIEDIKCVRYD